MKTFRWSTTLLLVAAACGGPAEDTTRSAARIDTTASYVAPAGSAVSYPANTVPTILAPGERVNIAVTAQNDGATSPDNDWGVNQYALFQQNTTFQATAPRVYTATPITNQYDYRLVITAPQTVGPHTFAARSYSLVGGQTGYFGPTFSVPNITTDPTRRPFWGCALQSHTVPATMTPDSTAAVSITVINTGTQDWSNNGHCLRSRDNPVAEWGSSTTCVRNNALVAGSPQGTALGTGNTHTFNMTIRAPSAPGNYDISRQMYQLIPWTQGGVGYFRVSSNCFNIPVTVGAGGPDPWDAELDVANSNIPTNMAPGEVREVTVRMNNIGTETWPGNGTVSSGNTMIRSQNSPVNQWGSQTITPTSQPIPSGNFEDYTFVITAPSPAMSTVYDFNFQMFASGIPGVGFYGEVTPNQITVAPGTQRGYDSAVVQEVYPIMSPLRPETFRITMQNTGTETWLSGQYTLQSTNSPVNLYGTTSVNLPQDVAPGQQYEFVFAVQGPQNDGMYPSRWRMRHPNASVGNFGAETTGNVTVLDGCGDNILDAGEQCDDGNTVAGDGCSAGCQIEQRIFDTSQTPADRSFLGSVGTRSLDRVAIGDVNNNGVPDLAIGADGLPAPARYRAGTILLVEAGPGFFDGTEADPTASAWLRIDGARVDDFLGGTVEGRILIGDVTGDGIDDIVASAPRGACASGMDTCGRGYVIRGGAGLNAIPNNLLDLSAPTADVVATFTAPNDGDTMSILAIGELTGDAFDDIVIGMIRANGEAGRVVVVQGGPTLTSATLNAAGVYASFDGLAAFDRLGQTAAVGDITGDGVGDLVISASAHDPAGGGQDAGGVWAFFGPLSNVTVYDLATNFSARWFGEGVRDAYGTGLAIGDVTGNADNDLIIGGDATRFGGVRYGAVDAWAGPIAGGSTFDLSAAATPDIRYQGVDPADGFGHCLDVAEFSNVNRGGKADIISVATFSQGFGNPFTHAGETHLFMGSSADVSGQIDTNLTLAGVYGSGTPDRQCYYRGSLAIGDLDNDGDQDFCISGRGASGARGRVDCVMNAW